MTKQHPLTDEMCEKIAPTCQWVGDIGDTVFRHSDMRDAADWQLEQVIKYLENDLEFVLWSDDFMDKFKKAMRPQQQENQ